MYVRALSQQVYAVETQGILQPEAAPIVPLILTLETKRSTTSYLFTSLPQAFLKSVQQMLNLLCDCLLPREGQTFMRGKHVVRGRRHYRV